ncbi:MAG: hypothetical protein KC423_09345 [Anaerolineales bacterium]|nr:hypothetical protein [Anaerolineales bacterium]
MLKRSCVRTRIFVLGMLFSLLISYLFWETTHQHVYADEQAAILNSSETLIAHFAKGPYAVTTMREYQGPVTVTITGIGQASATQYSDAFYILTDNFGNPINPVHPTLLYNWVLWINGQHAENFIPGQQVPSYRSNNSYTFQINAPGGPLVFGVGDVGTGDNTGSFTITVGNDGSCEVPFFSQIDPQWRKHPLRTDGSCDMSCNTIGACGCTLTAAAMNFAYLGADLNPATLSDCMGANACMFRYGAGASCTNGKASYAGSRQFTNWLDLDRELNQNGRLVILGFHKAGNASQTHWVLVTAGQGSDPSNYLAHDPGSLQGANTNLQSFLRDNWVPKRILLYDGQPACNPGTQLASSLSTQINNPFQSTEATFAPNINTMSEEPAAITGSITRYHLNETTIIVQLAASSTSSNITDMLIWSDSSPTPNWQPFKSHAWLPWNPGDQLHARFRDELGNISDTYTESLYPLTSPPTSPIMRAYLPLIIRNVEANIAP